MTTSNVLIEQGATFTLAVALASGYDGLTPRATIRDAFGGTALATLTCTVVSGNSTTLSLTAAETAALIAGDDARPGERDAILGHWDLETESLDGVVVRHRQGTVVLSREVTT